MKYKLYDYQQEVYDKICALLAKGERKILAVLPTRSGKSGIISKLVEDAQQVGQTVWFIAHTNILIFQMSDELTDHGIKHGIISPHAPQLKYRIQIASKDSLVSRLKKMLAAGWRLPDNVIIDEVHMAKSKTFMSIIDLMPEKTKIFGFTGSPCRQDGKSLGDIFDHMVIGPSIKDLQKRGRLAPVETYAVDLFDDTGIKRSMGDYNQVQVSDAVDKSFVLSEIVRHWEKLAKGLKTLTFAVNITHAEHLAQQFTDAGYPSVAISSADGQDGIKKKLADYYAGKYINMVSVNLFLMGFHLKECRCIIQARPTQSLMVFLQSCGRGMIPNPDGSPLINIDACNNYTRHGLPDDDRTWSLDPEPKRKKQVSKYKRCPECMRPVLTTARKCEHCGFLFVEVEAVGTRLPEEREGKLVKINRREAGDLTLKIAREAHTLKQAVGIAKDNGVAHTVAYDIWCNVLRNDAKAVLRF